MKVSLYPYMAAFVACSALVSGAFAQTASVQQQQAEIKMLMGMGKDISDKLTAIEQQMNAEFAYIGNRCGSGDQMVDGSSGCRPPNGARMRVDDIPVPVFNAPPAAAQPVAAVDPPPGYNRDGTPIVQDTNCGGGGENDVGCSGGGVHEPGGQ